MNENLKYTLSLQDLLSKKIDAAVGSVSRLDKAVNGVGNTIKGALAGAAIYNFGKSVVQSLKNYEYFSASLRTLMNGDAQSAKVLESQLVKMAAKTPFELTELQDATKQLTGYGFAAGDVTKNISMLGDVASGLSIPFSDIAYLYGTLRTQGRAYTKDIMQFTSRGIPIIKELAKQFKVTDSQMMKLVEDGKVGFSDVEKAFKSMTSEGGQFFNMMDAQSKTVGGQLSNMGDQWEQLKVNIGKSTKGIIASVTEMASSILTNLNQGIEATNLMDKAFEKSRLNFGFWEEYVVGLLSKIGMLFGGDPVQGGWADMQNYASGIQENLTGANDIVKLRKQIDGLWAELDAIKNNSEMDTLEKSRRVSIINEALDQNIAAINLIKNGKADKNKSGYMAGVSSTGNSTLGSSSEISGARPQNLTINITKLVEKLEVSTTNMVEGASKVKEMVSKALLEAVNDVNYIAK